MELHTIGIDLGKTVFHLVGLNLRGEVVVRKKFTRKQLLHFTANSVNPRAWLVWSQGFFSLPLKCQDIENVAATF